MLNLFRPATLPLLIDGGRVSCPLRGSDVDIDLCAGCRWLSEFNDKGRPATIVCRPELPPPGLLQRLM